MNITITKAELREITRIFYIGMTVENNLIEEQNTNDEILEDEINLWCKLIKIAEDNNVKIDLMEETENNEEETIKKFIKQRKRTYTTSYWNFTEALNKILDKEE